MNHQVGVARGVAVRFARAAWLPTLLHRSVEVSNNYGTWYQLRMALKKMGDGVKGALRLKSWNRRGNENSLPSWFSRRVPGGGPICSARLHEEDDNGLPALSANYSFNIPTAVVRSLRFVPSTRISTWLAVGKYFSFKRLRTLLKATATCFCPLYTSPSPRD